MGSTQYLEADFAGAAKTRGRRPGNASMGVRLGHTAEHLERSLEGFLGVPDLDLDFVAGTDAGKAVPKPARGLFRGTRCELETREILVLARPVARVTTSHRFCPHVLACKTDLLAGQEIGDMHLFRPPWRGGSWQYVWLDEAFAGAAHLGTTVPTVSRVE